jgi:aspartyl protease family protein
MWKPLVAMISIGLVIGLAWPTERAQLAAASQPAAGESLESRLERESNGHFYVHAKVNGELVRFIVDTGATGVALTVKDAKRVGIPFSASEFEHVGEGASGPVRGKIVNIDMIDFEGKTAENVSGVILEGSELSLLGQSYLSRFEIQMRGDYMVLR